MIQYFLEDTGGSSQKETGRKEKRWRESFFSYMKIYVNIYTYRLPLISIHVQM